MRLTGGMPGTHQRSLVLLIAVLLVAGCHASGDAAATGTPAARAATPAKPRTVVTKKGFGTGPFARVQIGDTLDQVRAAVGEPTENRGHLMGKNFNPFYWGGDRYHRIWYYAGKGRVTFNTKARVMIIENDPSEDGKDN